MEDANGERRQRILLPGECVHDTLYQDEWEAWRCRDCGALVPTNGGSGPSRASSGWQEGREDAADTIKGER